MIPHWYTTLVAMAEHDSHSIRSVDVLAYTAADAVTQVGLDGSRVVGVGPRAENVPASDYQMPHVAQNEP